MTKSNKSIATKSSNVKKNAKVAEVAKSEVVASQITIQSSAKSEEKKSDDATQAVTIAKSSNASSKRITIFNKSLTSVVKAFCNQLDLSTSDALKVTARLASRNDYAKASVTTAMSDAKNAKYAKVVAVLSDDEVKQVRKTLETIAREEKQATSSK